MKVIALYKVWDGEEWLMPSIKSIYNHCEKIVLLTSDVSWIGQRDNPSIPEIKRILKEFDPDKKIIHLQKDEPNQLKHCNYAYDWIKAKYPDCTHVMLMDSDEVFSNDDIDRAFKYLEDNPNHMAYRCRLYTYIKSPFYRIDPIEPLSPVIFVNTKRDNMGLEPRGCGVKPFVTMQEVYYHHFTWVRDHVNKTFIKIIQSHVSEKQPMHDIDTWIANIWNRLPHGNNLHIARGFAHNWKRIRVIGRKELPEVLQGGIPIIMKFD